MGKRLYVGNLSFKATQEDISELFSRFGEIISISIVTEPETGRSRGFGFVEMTTQDASRRAIRALSSSLFMGRTLAVSEAMPSREEGKNAAGAERSHHNTELQEDGTKKVSERLRKKEAFRLLRKKHVTEPEG